MYTWFKTSRKAKLALALLLFAVAMLLTGQITPDQLLSAFEATIMTLIASIAVEDGLSKAKTLTPERELFDRWGK